MTFLDMDQVKVDPAVALLLPATVALRRRLLPFAANLDGVHVACLDPDDHSALSAVEKFLTAPVRPERAEPESLARAIDRVYGDLAGAGDHRGKPRSVDMRSRPRSVDLGDTAVSETVSLGEELLHAALIRQASDIHLEPKPGGLKVRFRVDGELEDHREVAGTLAAGLVNRLKVLSGLDIAERRAPQDGGFKHRYARGTQSVDIRTATLPTRHGERVTLRLLSLQTELLTMEKLGLGPKDLTRFERAIDLPHGLILLTGPTGSGKSTTLYAALRALLAREKANVLTVEDPIEYEIPGVSQVEVDSADKVSFLKALRSVLRHDPDVLMIGEIRDAETADVAIKASLTGHLVFSTLHTNSALSVVTRLIDMGVERYLIAATLRLAVAQRLVRRLCPHCRRARELTVAEAAALADPSLAGRTVYDPVGCIYCASRGVAGRLGLFELVPITEEWAQAIAAGSGDADFRGMIKETHTRRLLDDGVDKLLQGQATAKDIIAAVNDW